MVGTRLALTVALWLGCGAAHAGPEPDAGYKLLVLVIAAAGLIVAQAGALGFVARSLGAGFWRWGLAQFLTTSAGLVLFGSVLGSWSAHPQMSALDLLLTDLVFDTWSRSNLLLLAAWAIFSLPTIALALWVFRQRVRPGDSPGPR